MFKIKLQYITFGSKAKTVLRLCVQFQFEINQNSNHIFFTYIYSYLMKHEHIIIYVDKINDT